MNLWVFRKLAPLVFKAKCSGAHPGTGSLGWEPDVGLRPLIPWREPLQL